MKPDALPWFEAAAFIGALCGSAMVLGGILLVWKGVITLAATPHSDALTIEWKKQFRINTQVPGLAFFLVGLLFIYTSLMFLKPPTVIPLELEGELKGVDEPWSLTVRPSNWDISGTAAGTINGKIYPDLSYLVLAVSAPGYEPFVKTIKVGDSSKRLAHIGTLELQRKVSKREIHADVERLPFQVAAPVAHASPTFGEAE